MHRLKTILILFVVAFAFMANAGILHATSTPIDISTWNQEGDPNYGVWIPQPDGSVEQTINYWWVPSFYVSPNTYINTTITAKMKVAGDTTGDDDYIGLVFGYQSPLSENSDPYNKFNFLVFDWKQAYQNFNGIPWPAGFSLAKADGYFGANATPEFHGHYELNGYDLLDTDLGSARGWLDDTEYTVTLLYHTDHLKIDVAGGQFGSGETIFDMNGSFPEGRIGFYNFCQPYAFYYDVTQENGGVVPEPATMALFAIGLGGVAIARGKKKAFFRS